MKKEQRKRLKELKKKGQDSLTSSEAHELCRLKFVARSDKDLVLVIISSFMCVAASTANLIVTIIQKLG